jgi:hypothetical protein
MNFTFTQLLSPHDPAFLTRRIRGPTIATEREEYTEDKVGKNEPHVQCWVVNGTLVTENEMNTSFGPA